MLIMMMLCLLFNALQVNIVDMFIKIQQELNVVKVINFSNLAMVYKFLEWFMLLSAPVLRIGLFITAKKGREILYWWILV